MPKLIPFPFEKFKKPSVKMLVIYSRINKTIILGLFQSLSMRKAKKA